MSNYNSNEDSNIQGLLKDLLNMYEKNRAMCLGVMDHCGLHFIQGKLQFTPFIPPTFIENALRADADDCEPVVEVESHHDESNEDDREALLAEFEQRKEEIDDKLVQKRRQEREEELKAKRRRLLDDDADDNGARGETKAPPERRLKRHQQRFRNDTVSNDFPSKFAHKYMIPKNAI